MSVHVLGIRHHGPGSARSVQAFLQELKPDIVLVEGPPEADGILDWVLHAELQPPVAILCYRPDDTTQSVFYPFAEFSPEWQAIRFAKQQKIPVRFFDLPMSHQFALKKEHIPAQTGGLPPLPAETPAPEPLDEEATEPALALHAEPDPVNYLAQAAGYADGESWWEQMFEYRRDREQVFEAVNEAMQSLREHAPASKDKREQLREAYMRRMIRQAEREMYSNIAVVCGAWHAPALTAGPKQKDDNELLKGLPKVKVECTWIPWTYNRLSYYSGYGAGIASPGWYEHTWNYPNDDGTRWMSRVASLFRKAGLDTSVAHVIEAVRLAEALASLRGRSKAGLEELNEATLGVLCNGEQVQLQLVHKELIVSDRIGGVPTDIPKPPLQMDIEKLQKSLRLPPTADFKDYTLDLRKEMDLARSVLLHRLQLLDIQWGRNTEVSGKGTFKEQWRLQWDPAFSIEIIEKGSWGNTVEEAASNYMIRQANETTSLPRVAAALQAVLPAELQRATEVLVTKMSNLSAASGDVLQLVEAIPALVNVVRYGNVRKTNADLVLEIARSMITRVCIGLPNAVTGIDEASATLLITQVRLLQDALALLQEEALTAQWQQTLSRLSAAETSAPVIAGYATRLLADYKLLAAAELVNAFHYRMSAIPDASAAWLEGFLTGSGSILLVDNDLWSLVNNWVQSLDSETFTQVLPLLRRTFSAFTAPERRKLGEKVKLGDAAPGIRVAETGLDAERAARGIPVVMQLLGLIKN